MRILVHKQQLSRIRILYFKQTTVLHHCNTIYIRRLKKMEFQISSALLLVSYVAVAMTMEPTYKVAVYEHVIISPEDPESEFTREEAFNWMSKNLQVYEKQTRIAALQGVDMIVFPEYGVTGFDQSRDSLIPFLEDIPDPEVDWNPCDDPKRFPNTLVLNFLSCMAKQYSMYVIANVGDYKECDATSAACPLDGRFQFNTNVVFDKSGKLTARYHKLNLYDESPLFDAAPGPEYVTFETPFGRFGTVVCFDLMHLYPTQILLQQDGVNNLLVTSAWNVFYPFVLSTQMYSGISKINDINIIASNARNNEYFMASSGIFGPGVESVLSDPEFTSDKGVLLISDLKGDAHTEEESYSKVSNLKPIYNKITDLPYMNESHFGTYDYGMNMSFVVLSENNTEAIVCDGIVCCAIKYKMNPVTPKELFILAASDFSMDDPGKVHLQFCALHRCNSSHDTETCGERVSFARTTFGYLKIQAFLDVGLVSPLVATTPYRNITIDTEKDNYSFDKNLAIFESRSLKHPILSVVVFNSVNETFYPNEDILYHRINIGKSLSNGDRPKCTYMSAVIQFIVTIAIWELLTLSIP